MNKTLSKAELKAELIGKLQRHFGKDLEEATSEQLYMACAFLVRDILMKRRHETRERIEETESKQVYYLSMEFLVGRNFRNHLSNLELMDAFDEVLRDCGTSVEELAELERDPGLGNGGLGRLAACYLDALTAMEYPAMGFSILYEYGIFRQKFLEGRQVELPDEWLGSGNVWMVPRMDEVQEIRFGGTVDTTFDDGKLGFVHKNYYTVLAVPNDMLVSGFRSSTVDTLRLWSAKSKNTIDMSLFSQGEYAKAMEQKAMSEVISKVLYPEDNHPEGKSLRLKQQYFFVSATIQCIVKRHKAQYGTLDNFADKAIIHINDTHPTVAIPELMRILMDEEGYGWDEAWAITSKCMAYTNHTIMAEALERWTVSMFRDLLPRIYQIVEEINRRFFGDLCREFPYDPERVGRLVIIANDEVRMANLCIASCYSVNGVSALHSDILKEKVFSDYHKMFPGKFCNVTNGIAHRRWLMQANPKLSNLICELIGDGFLKTPTELENLMKYERDSDVLAALGQIKRGNKAYMANMIGEQYGIEVSPDSIFDVQAKRLHEYKRQLLNVLHIMHDYVTLKDNPNMDFRPKTYLFGAKAAAGYYMAKQIIRLIHSLASEINADPVCKDKLCVVFLEDYNVTLAERLIPSADISEQISIAGKEASGTGNMKFMMNGALTMGTLDGANVEIHETVGDCNMFLFGLRADEVERINHERSYVPGNYYHSNPALRRILDWLRDGVGVGILRASYPEIVDSLLFTDTYMVLADFDDYCRAQRLASEQYGNGQEWNRKCLINIAGSGRFAADRSVGEYAENIWRVKTLV